MSRGKFLLYRSGQVSCRRRNRLLDLELVYGFSMADRSVLVAKILPTTEGIDEAVRSREVLQTPLNQELRKALLSPEDDAAKTSKRRSPPSCSGQREHSLLEILAHCWFENSTGKRTRYDHSSTTGWPISIGAVLLPSTDAVFVSSVDDLVLWIFRKAIDGSNQTTRWPPEHAAGLCEPPGTAGATRKLSSLSPSGRPTTSTMPRLLKTSASAISCPSRHLRRTDQRSSAIGDLRWPGRPFRRAVAGSC